MNNDYWEIHRQVLIAPTLAFERVRDAGFWMDSAKRVIGMALLSALVLAVVDLFATTLGPTVSGLAKNIVVMPVLALLTWFALSVFMFVVWKMLGGQEKLSVAARCISLVFVLLPLWSLADVIGRYAQIIVILWAAALLIIASQQVHKIALWKAVIAVAVLALIAIRYACSCCGSDVEPAVSSGALFDEQVDEQVTVHSEPATDKTSVEDDSIINQSTLPPTELQEKLSSDTRFSLSPADAGYKLGEMVREVSDSVTEIGEEFKRGLDATDAQPPVNDEQAVDAVSETSEQSQTPALPAVSPEQLGQLLGRFVRDMDRLANDMEQGYSDAVNADTSNAEASDITTSAEQAGKVLGDFVRGYNEATGSTDQAVPPGDPAAAAESASP